jgi:hypothetical protein
MSLVKSLFNQIGREIGRDVYRAGKQHILEPQVDQYNYDQNQSDPFLQIDMVSLTLLEQIENFELSTQDKSTMRKLSNLVEKSEKVDPESMCCGEIYLALVDKIDFVEDNIDSEYFEKIDSLRKINYLNFSQKSFLYKSIVQNQKDEQQKIVDGLKDTEVNVNYILKGDWFKFFVVLFFLSLFITIFNYSNGSALFTFATSVAVILSIIFRSNNSDESNHSNSLERTKLEEIKEHYQSLERKELMLKDILNSLNLNPPWYN